MPSCGAKTRSGTPCKKQAGWGTGHFGQGRCRLHGGATPIKHGRYSKVERETMGIYFIDARVEYLLQALRKILPYLDDDTRTKVLEAVAQYEAAQDPLAIGNTFMNGLR